MAPFIDCAFIGEAEELLPSLVLAWAAMRKQITAGLRTRADALAELASRSHSTCPRCTRRDRRGDRDTVVGAPLDPRVPTRVSRAMIETSTSIRSERHAGAVREAVFERASVEIARGCTEGCRFCQAA